MTDQNQILVIGGTGKTGKRVVERLTEAGKSYRLGTPDADVPFDWYDDTTWDAALQNIKSVYSVFYPDYSVPHGLQIFEKFIIRAKQAGVEHIVLLSGRNEQEAEEAEQLVIHSGIDWTVVRCSWFMQNFSENFFLEDILRGEVALPVNPAVTEPFVDANDIADVVFAALVERKHRGHLYELTGPELLTFKDALDRIAEVTGRPINYVTVTLEEYEQGMRQAGLSEVMINLMNYLFRDILDGRNQYLSDGVKQALGREPGSFNDYVKRTADDGTWNA